MGKQRVLSRLREAADDGRLVRITRGRRWDRLDGSVVALGAKWLLLATEVDAGFDGHTLVRVADVRRVAASSSARFLERALRAEGHWPLPALDGVDVSSTRAALRSLSAISPLISVFYERAHPDECLIGVPRRYGRRRFRLQNVDPNAEWDEPDSAIRYREVSRIDVGGAYERRLAAVAGPPP
ncbi:MAG TPA: hypothetical protein VGC37_04685 [Friedmanniella sp.]